MSKALVITGANFTTNKVETITLGEAIPCTGISLSAATMTGTTLGVIGSLTATLTPNNTTDTLTWASSDTTVATVADGVVTCTGVGSATITATCGSHSATCTVTTTVALSLSDYSSLGGKAYSGSLSIPTKTHIGVTSDTKGLFYYDDTDELGGYHVFYTSGYENCYAIPIPAGATSMALSITGSSYTPYAKVILCDTLTESIISGVSGGSAAGLVMYNMGGATTATYDISEYTTANGFVFSVSFSGGTYSDFTGDVTVTFT